MMENNVRRRIMCTNPRWMDRSGEIEQARIAQPLDTLIIVNSRLVGVHRFRQPGSLAVFVNLRR